MMTFVNMWQVMTPLTAPAGNFTRRYVPWFVASMHAKDAVRMVEQTALQMGLTFDGDIEVRRSGRILVTVPDD